MTRRFDSLEHLVTWKETGRWPAIHNAMAQFALSYAQGQRLVDMGCSYGLLGARIVRECRMAAGMGIEAAAEPVQLAGQAKVPLTIKRLSVARATMPALIQHLEEFGVQTMVCRRVLPELWGEDLEGGREFATAIRGAGVFEVLLQGRVDVGVAARNVLHNVEAEAELLSHAYRPVVITGDLAYLVAR